MNNDYELQQIEKIPEKMNKLIFLIEEIKNISKEMDILKELKDKKVILFEKIKKDLIENLGGEYESIYWLGDEGDEEDEEDKGEKL